MGFYIYKITNLINHKFYIGQTAKNIHQRLKRHCNDALSGRLNTPLAKAIRKYGKENFEISLIDEAQSKSELDIKEQMWIAKLNAIADGYNAATGGEGGNTYVSKPREELDIIREKLRKTKQGHLNPNAKQIKCKNILSGEELFFDTMFDCQKYFNEDNHGFITRRCSGKTTYIYNNQWLFAYIDENYPMYKTEKQNHRKRTVRFVNITTHEENIFSSYTNAERALGFPQGHFSKHAHRYKDKLFWEKSGYRIYVLK